MEEIFKPIFEEIKKSKISQACFIGTYFDISNPAFSSILFDVLVGQQLDYKTVIFPENDVHPRNQKKIREQWGGGNAIFITHSPIVASQFRQEEIFILDLEEYDKAQLRKPTENPRYLDLEGATEILFPEVDPKEPMHEDGVVKLKELKKLTRQIRKAKKEVDKKTIEELYPKYEQLADELNAYRYYPEYTLLYELGKICRREIPQGLDGQSMSSDEILQYWFGTNSHSEKYEKAVSRYYQLAQKDLLTQGQTAELMSLVRGTHPTFGAVLKNSTFFG